MLSVTSNNYEWVELADMVVFLVDDIIILFSLFF